MNKRKSTPYHEGGHAVALMRFGFGCGRVTIIENQKENAAGSTNPMECADYDDMDQTGLTNYVIALLAGYAAAVEHNPTGKKEAALGASSDFEKAKDLLRRLGLRRDLRPWLVKARQFVRQEWRAIEMIAQEVLDLNTLDDAEVELILGYVDGDAEALVHLGQHRLLMGRGPTRQFKFTIQRTASSGSEASSGLDHL